MIEPAYVPEAVARPTAWLWVAIIAFVNQIMGIVMLDAVLQESIECCDRDVCADVRRA